MEIKTTALVLALLAGTAMPALADERSGQRRGPDISQIDTNGDGEISVEELNAHHVARQAKLDANSDGEISAEELMAAEQARRAERMVKRFDKNEDGILQADEMPGANFDAAELDRDEDGIISEKEMRRGMREMHHGERKHRRGGRGHGRGHGRG